MSRKKYIPIENPTGVGEVWKKDEKIAKVSYNLNVYQEIIIAETLKETSEIEGLKFMDGSITIIEGARDIWGRDKLVLNIEDGRKVGFFVKSGDPISGHFQIQPSGDFY